MAEFLDPFRGVVPRLLADSELVRAILLNIAAEMEAVHIYTAHADATENADAKKVLLDIANEELVHAGEFTSLLYRLNPEAAAKAMEGFGEVRTLLGSPAPLELQQPEETAAEPEPEIPIPQGLTVGNLLTSSPASRPVS